VQVPFVNSSFLLLVGRNARKPEAEYNARVELCRQKVRDAIDAELAWLAGKQGEPEWPQAFAELERKYPQIRRELISKNFKNWKDHRDFLLRHIQMMRARSLLFFDQKNTEGKNLRAWVVEEVNPDRKSVKVRSMTPEPLPPQFIQNWTITQMREEIQKGAAWLSVSRPVLQINHGLLAYANEPRARPVEIDDYGKNQGDG
jgi:hypothetical protein